VLRGGREGEVDAQKTLDALAVWGKDLMGTV